MPTLPYFKAALSKISQGIVIFDQDHRIVFANKPYQLLMEIPDDIVREGKSAEQLIQFMAHRGEFGALDAAGAGERAWDCIRSNRAYRNERERPNGRYIVVAGDPFEDGGYVYTITDVTDRHREKQRLAAEVGEKTRELRKVNRELNRLAALDPLLAIPNRRRFSSVAEVIFKQMARNHASSTVMVLDIDHFKLINDENGHPAGDKVLIELVRRIKLVLKPNDHIARYGGEEFVILLPLISLADGLTVAEEVRDAIATSPMAALNSMLPVTVSIGLAEWSPSESNIEEALTRADTALYDAKREGRNRCRFVV